MQDVYTQWSYREYKHLQSFGGKKGDHVVYSEAIDGQCS